ncbi:MAG: hypothetical protein HY834_20615 [Devosia nanyangense]|uniref:Immunity MXAN-0049 protein domain-containing protein n=1 Tax=Devosia nanyangense TaxID=1228055 RepID=A0A933L866_9HYPH|nr:hypothetical protein [Devosia nanyangense]
MPIDYGGVVVDFNFAPFDMLVVRASLGEAIEALAGAAVQRLPVTLAGQPNVFEILNICQRVPCVDEERSSYVRWTDADGRPDKVGQFRYFKRLRVDSALAQGHHLFRIAEWSIVPIASRQMKDVIERAGATGVAFEPV